MLRSSFRPVALACALVALVPGAVPVAQASDNIKNVIVMVPDGCSSTVFTAARWYKGAPLHIDKYARGLLQTYMLDSVITDSAAAATAFASGVKTSDGFVGVMGIAGTTLSTEVPPTADEEYRPVATVLEAAKVLGKATGLVATSRITHATPAAFASHIWSRNLDNEIMEHMVYLNVDAVFGGGKRHLLPTTAPGGKRTDGEDLLQVLLDRGYEFVDTRDQLLAKSAGRMWGLFNASHMQADIDRAVVAPTEPSLAEMTAKAIEILSQDPDGFFLMVEGSQIDWAGHNQDPIYMITDTLAFDEAWKVALDFAKADGNTMLVAFPDHNTGAMSLGHQYTEHGYTATTVEDIVAPLEGMKVTSVVVATDIAAKAGKADPAPQAIVDGVKEWWGLDISTADAQAVLDYMASDGQSLNYALAHVISERYTYFGWTTHGHTGEDVPIWSYGPGRHRPVGGIDNTEIPKWIARSYGVSLEALNQFLFCDVEDYFADYAVAKADPANPVLVIGDVEFPVSKDVARVPALGVEFSLPGLVVHAPKTDRYYLPMVGIALAEGFNGSAKANTMGRLRQLADELGYDLDLPDFAALR